MNGYRFSCSPDKYSKVISAYVLLFGLALIIIPFFLKDQENSKSNSIMMLVGGLLLLTTLFFFLFAPTAYLISQKGLTIERRWRSKIILLEDILLIRSPEEKELSWPVRTFGNGGLFGYTGRYYAKHIGSMIWYCTRRDKQVIIERKFSLPVVISPDEPTRMIWAWGELKRPDKVSE